MIEFLDQSDNCMGKILCQQHSSTLEHHNRDTSSNKNYQNIFFEI